VVASSKIPDVASEYISGKMGGASGQGRSFGCGYFKNKKPKHRCLGNGYAISIELSDYKEMRENNMLIDVNVDVSRGLVVNKSVSEVTFAGEIPERLVKGSMPMVLPRFDRSWKDMSQEKKEQYKKIFNIDEKKYKTFQESFSEKTYPIGIILEHLINYHALLLNKIAIRSDREDGYDHKFIVAKHKNYFSSYLKVCFTKNKKTLGRVGKGKRKREAPGFVGEERSGELSDQIRSYLEENDDLCEADVSEVYDDTPKPSLKRARISKDVVDKDREI
jgi:hypothetical protein